MDERRTMHMATTPEIVKQGIDLFAEVETSLKDAEEGLLKIRNLFAQAYANGDLDGVEAINARISAIHLSSNVGSCHAAVLEFHQLTTKMAKAADQDIAQPYAELPPRSTKGSGR